MPSYKETQEHIRKFKESSRKISTAILPRGKWDNETCEMVFDFNNVGGRITVESGGGLIDVSLFKLDTWKPIFFELSDPNCVEKARKLCDEYIIAEGSSNEKE